MKAKGWKLSIGIQSQSIIFIVMEMKLSLRDQTELCTAFFMKGNELPKTTFALLLTFLYSYFLFWSDTFLSECVFV
jgi:hypothetical protein